jgi:hypothetical protein
MDLTTKYTPRSGCRNAKYYSPQSCGYRRHSFIPYAVMCFVIHVNGSKGLHIRGILGGKGPDELRYWVRFPDYLDEVRG